MPPGSDTLWFVNPPSLQSVPAIWHAHIFVRQAEAGGAQERQEWRWPQSVEPQQQEQQRLEAGAAAAVLGAGEHA